MRQDASVLHKKWYYNGFKKYYMKSEKKSGEKSAVIAKSGVRAKGTKTDEGKLILKLKKGM